MTLQDIQQFVSTRTPTKQDVSNFSLSSLKERKKTSSDSDKNLPNFPPFYRRRWQHPTTYRTKADLILKISASASKKN